MALAAIALGSNLPGQAGSREANLAGAVTALATLGKVQAESRYYDTDPVGYTDQPRFLNAAVLLETVLTPQELLAELLRIEGEFGRDRSHGIEKGPRTLDLDLLFYDEQVLAFADLHLPHPALHLRRFVLEPLAEVAPQWRHPVYHQTVAEMLTGVS